MLYMNGSLLINPLDTRMMHSFIMSYELVAYKFNKAVINKFNAHFHGLLHHIVHVIVDEAEFSLRSANIDENVFHKEVT